MNYPKPFTAHHEAGHAVINLRLGFDVAMVTIKPDPRRGSEGYVKSAPGGRLWKIVDDVRIAHRGEQQISSVRSVMDRTLVTLLPLSANAFVVSQTPAGGSASLADISPGHAYAIHPYPPGAARFTDLRDYAVRLKRREGHGVRRCCEG